MKYPAGGPPALFWFYRTDQKLIGIRPDVTAEQFTEVLKVSRKLGYAIVHHSKGEQP